jgi:hypothetical protein
MPTSMRRRAATSGAGGDGRRARGRCVRTSCPAQRMAAGEPCRVALPLVGNQRRDPADRPPGADRRGTPVRSRRAVVPDSGPVPPSRRVRCGIRGPLGRWGRFDRLRLDLAATENRRPPDVAGDRGTLAALGGLRQLLPVPLHPGTVPVHATFSHALEGSSAAPPRAATLVQAYTHYLNVRCKGRDELASRTPRHTTAAPASYRDRRGACAARRQGGTR